MKMANIFLKNPRWTVMVVTAWAVNSLLGTVQDACLVEQYLQHFPPRHQQYHPSQPNRRQREKSILKLVLTTERRKDQLKYRFFRGRKNHFATRTVTIRTYWEILELID